MKQKVPTPPYMCTCGVYVNKGDAPHKCELRPQPPRKGKTIDTTRISREATEASCYFDAAAQFGVPDLVRWLKTAYYHGYRDALIKERLSPTQGEK